MEHLLRPGQRAPIAIPYYQPQKDKAGKLKSLDEYSELAGVVLKPIPSLNSDEISIVWHERFVDGQILGICNALFDRLYFGLLYMTLGLDINIADFVVRYEDGSVFLTTAKLEENLEAFKIQIEELDLETKAALRESTYDSLKMGDRAITLLGEFLDWSYENVAITEAFADDDEPLGNTHFACAILHSALVSACMKIFDADMQDALQNHFNRSPWLLRRMSGEGWCPYTIQKLHHGLKLEGMVYANSLGSVRNQKTHHDSCSSRACLANNVSINHRSPSIQQTHGSGLQHVSSECNCPVVDAPLAEIILILEPGQLPVLKIQVEARDTANVSISVRSVDPSISNQCYVAISHVWADGIGSPSSNTTTQCQLIRLADRLTPLEALGPWDGIHVWMDTMCIPVDLRYSHLRDAAVARMHQVYGNAYAVLVVDADLARMVAQPPIVEFGMRLFMSA